MEGAYEVEIVMIRLYPLLELLAVLGPHKSLANVQQLLLAANPSVIHLLVLQVYYVVLP